MRGLPTGFLLWPGHGGRVCVRNRGYRFIIRDLGFDRGCAAMCINSTWINELLKDHGVDPVIFRKLKWNDLAAVCKSGRGRQIFEDLKPKNFWQMCDVVSLMYVKYDSVGNGQAYRKRWFKQYPILVEEDIYEFLLEEGFSQEEAMELTVFYKDHPEKKYRKDVRDMLELYDVPDDISSVILDAGRLPARENMIRELMKLIRLAAGVYVEQSVYRESKEVC
jgi:hypothetical protein